MNIIYVCPLRCCDFTLVGTDIQAGIDEHEAAHLEDADNLRIVKLSEANITRPTTVTFGDVGVSVTLERVISFGQFGETQGVDYDVQFTKAHGSDEDPSIHPSQIPDLILELERLHGIWKHHKAGGSL